MLAAAMNPCPCGFFNDPTRKCKSSPIQIQRYMSKICSSASSIASTSRIDVPAVKFKELASDTPAESLGRYPRTSSTRARRVRCERFPTERIFLQRPDVAAFDTEVLRDGFGFEGFVRERDNAAGIVGASLLDRILKVSRTLGRHGMERENRSRSTSSEAIQYRTLDQELLGLTIEDITVLNSQDAARISDDKGGGTPRQVQTNRSAPEHI